MELLDPDLVGQGLGTREIGDVDEGILGELVGDALPGQPHGQGVVAVEVELKAERSPGRHAQVAQAKLLVDEVEVVVKALPIVRLEERPSGLLVVPRLEGETGLQGGEDVDESRVSPALGEDLLDPGLLPKVLLADELDLQAVVLGQVFGVVDLVPQGLGPAGEVEQRTPLTRRWMAMASAWQISGRVPVMMVRSKQVSTPRMRSAYRSVRRGLPMLTSGGQHCASADRHPSRGHHRRRR